MSRYDDPDSPDYQETSVGLGMVPDRKPVDVIATPDKQVEEMVKTLHEDMDASRWAREFMKVWNRGVQMDEGWMIGWFANAIMCGYDEANRRSKSQSKPEPGGEVCQECGHAYDYVYSVPYEIWARISPKPAPAGLLCPVCALNKIAASSQNVGAEKDAARYRWLRDNFMYTQDDKTSTACIYIPYGVELGAAIDAAMREQEGK